ncbi:hypothetical protein SAMN05428988_3219 [Chitinophaga sp. YR573]|uniref:hypothetical protein n=1 Tax=Chitinophaga sp. YR573 TaxID=1881040 RepID=UPI0008B55AB4|nr:hypothetical protein [Chitinophaga sp. YR573]SEW21516.1 hypothetical protein SAMN05428988_3219 [Chitinophaga sp. YR573]
MPPVCPPVRLSAGHLNSFIAMGCDCNKTNYECNGVNVSSDCVIWRGDPIPLLGICTGDPLTFLEMQIIDKIAELLDKEDKTLEDFDVSTCPALSSKLLGKEPQIASLLQIIWTNQCSLGQAITQLQQKVDAEKPTPYPFQLVCITPPGGGSSSDAILQGVLNKVCELQTQLATVAPAVEEATKIMITEYLGQVLRGLGSRGIVKSGTGSNQSFLFNSFVPPYCPLPYYGPVTNFDATGKGLVGTAYEGWYFMSGLNGIPDLRGRTLVAAVKDIPGLALDSEIDPTKADNAGTNYIPGQKFGYSFVKLLATQMPVHNHGVVDPGHYHQSIYPTPEKFSGNKFDSANQSNTTLKDTSIAKTGITIANSGGGQSHDNRQPSFTITGYIMRID